MNALLDKLMAVGSIKSAGLLSESPFFNETEFVTTPVPIINAALSGSLKGGLMSGILLICGESKRFKSLLGLLLVRSYLKQHKDSICLFYNSEFGITKNYFESLDIPLERIIEIPVMHLEQLKFDLTKKLDAVNRGEKVIVFIDSIGNLASKKEAEDALNENVAADMTRAKVIKSIFRIATPHLTSKDIPLIGINHIYKEQGAMYPKDVVSGGTGIYLSSNDIWIITRSQDKDGTEVVGWNFTINIEKSRKVREKAKFIFTVNYNKGLDKWSGLMDIALDTGHVAKPKQGWYTRPNVTGDKNWRLAESSCADFWNIILEDEKFHEAVSKKFELPDSSILQDDSLTEE